MDTPAAPDLPPQRRSQAQLGVFLTLVACACAVTLVILGGRDVMAVGGSCSSGNTVSYEPECPPGAFAMFPGIIVGIFAFVRYGEQTSKHGVPSLMWLAIPALPLYIGSCSLASGLRPPGGDGLDWVSLVMAAVFLAIGAMLLPASLRTTLREFTTRSVRVYWLALQLLAIPVGIFAGVQFYRLLTS
ncbi:MAG TPA: hypothetical protein VF746_23380 [Longimicrobium sp.]|jgi:hypothetical protein